MTILSHLPACGNTLGALPIENGGTGATNAEGAIENLGLEEYILNLINTSGSGGEMKPYLMMSVVPVQKQDTYEYLPLIAGYGFAATFGDYSTSSSGGNKHTEVDIVCSIPGTYIISSTYTNWNETWNVSSIPATKTLESNNATVKRFGLSISPA